MKINIAIDGPSAAGKSTISELLARRLNYVHLDTGAMYRATALKALQEGISLEDEQGVVDMLADTEIRMSPDGTVFLDGQDVSAAIRQDKISMAASNVSKHKEVRRVLVERQQKLAAEKGYIMDGRDIGTVVLKDAEVKIYLTASSYARALRRLKQNRENNISGGDLETIRKEIEARDYQDMHRENSPLTKAEDAIEVDSSDLTIEETVEKILALAMPFITAEETI
ncbi:MAG: (d)CMP kinase [Solobacterium sp.]|nr:(d)CMP kinase [Solobacterium sp.]